MGNAVPALAAALVPDMQMAMLFARSIVNYFDARYYRRVRKLCAASYVL
jgi:hypothetical protein